MRNRTAVAAGVAAIVGAFALSGAFGWRPGLDAGSMSATFDPSLVQRGAALAAIGDCDTCHTAPGGRAYAGRRGIPTPFGTIYSTNITPDPETGIGRWPEQAFVRAMREGVDRDGRHLYPVFPYDHFDIVDDDDLHALYAFLMTRDPVRSEAHANELKFPFGFRPLLAGWKSLYLHPRRFAPQPGQSAAWNRGAYLVEGLGHCGACHTPRNALGAVERDRPFAGGQAEHWDAPALDASSRAPVPWTRERLAAYLSGTVAPEQGIPAGPMLPVAHNLARVPNEDVDAIATYVASVAGAPDTGRQQRATAVQARVARDEELAATPVPAIGGTGAGDAASGAAMYAAACATCHGAGRGAGSAHAMHLALSTSPSLPSATNLLHIIEDGVRPRPGERGRWMPSFRGAFTDAQLAELARYVRAEFGAGEPWRDVEQNVRDVRREGAHTRTEGS